MLCLSFHLRWFAETIVVVTGANRKIGFETTHKLATQGITIILLSREVAVGEESSVLQEGGLNVSSAQYLVCKISALKVNQGQYRLLCTSYMVCPMHQLEVSQRESQNVF